MNPVLNQVPPDLILSIQLQSSDTPNGGQLLAVHNNYAITLSGHLFKVVKNRHMKAWFPEVSGILQQLTPNMDYIAQSIAIAAPLNTSNKIEQEINNIHLRETLQTEKCNRWRDDEEINGNKAYNNKHQYIKAGEQLQLKTGLKH